MKAKSVSVIDYSGKRVEVAIPEKEIKAIFVTILSGDETGRVLFEDGEAANFDSSDCRVHDFYDGSYFVAGDKIQEWLEWVGNDSYDRQVAFDF